MFNLIKVSPIGGLGTSQRTGWGLYFKNEYDYRNKIFNKAVKVVRGNQWGLQDRYGLGMKPRTVCSNTRAIQNNIIMNPNNAPPKLNHKLSMIYLWSWIWIEGRVRYSVFSIPYILRWFKYQSFLTHLKRGIIKWIIQTSCIHYETV